MMIAMALMCEPIFVIADEPNTGLDVIVQSQILQLLASLQSELKLALLLIVHDLGVAADVADRVAVMYAGSIVECGSVEQIFSAPTHPYTRKLMDCIPQRGRPLRSVHRDRRWAPLSMPGSSTGTQMLRQTRVTTEILG